MTFEVREKSVAELERVAEGGEPKGPELQDEKCKVQIEKCSGADELEERSPFCAFVREDGGKCGAMARRPSEFCFWHEPERLAARQSERAGSTIDPLAFEPCDLKTGADVYGLLERAALYAALTPRPDLKRLQILNVLASTLLRSIHVKELEVEVAALRAEVAETERKYDRCWREAESERSSGRFAKTVRRGSVSGTSCGVTCEASGRTPIRFLRNGWSMGPRFSNTLPQKPAYGSYHRFVFRAGRAR